MSMSEPLPMEVDDAQLFDLDFELWEQEQIKKLESETVENWVKDLIWKDLKAARVANQVSRIERQPAIVLADDELPF